MSAFGDTMSVVKDIFGWIKKGVQKWTKHRRKSDVQGMRKAVKSGLDRVINAKLNKLFKRFKGDQDSR